MKNFKEHEAVIFLDKDLEKYCEQKEKIIPYFTHTFNGGEQNIAIDTENFNFEEIFTVNIFCRIQNSNDIINLMLLKDALNNLRIFDLTLSMPYLPYARQDRVCNKGEALSLKVFCNLINSMDFRGVIILDPHSDVSTALLNNVIKVNPYKYIKDAVEDINSESLCIVAPDAGAVKRVYDINNIVEGFINIVKCDKVRELKTGNLKGFSVHGFDDLCGTDCLIVDDICDGGRTFIGIAEELKRLNCGKLYLYITHGIFSNGYDELLKHFDKIYTTNSFRDLEPNEKIKVINIF